MYNWTNAIILGWLFSANGLYKLYTMLVPIPPSTKLSIESTLVRRPFTPKYSVPKLSRKTFLEIKPRRVITICVNILIYIFLSEFFILISFTLYPLLNF